MGVCCVCSKQTSSLPESLIRCTKCKLSVHKECYGIASQQSATEPWSCQRCKEGVGNERCELCPFYEGALKKTDNGRWAHILCAQYIPEVIFGNNYSMEPINLAEVPKPRFQQICYICDEQGDVVAKRQGACMQCNVQNCINCFHVTCGQRAGLLVAEDCDNRRIVDYYGFCSQHVTQNNKTATVKLTEPKYSHSAQKCSGLSTQIKVKSEKLPAVDTLVSQRLKDATKVITHGPTAFTLDSNTTSSIKPMQPKVRAYPLPFQGVHKQTSISLAGDIQNSESGVYTGTTLSIKEETSTTSTSSNTNSTSISSTTTSSTTSSSSTPLHFKNRKRKSSSSTDNEDVGEESVKTLQNLVNTADNKCKLIVVKQTTQDKETSGEGYNDLSEVFSKKVKKKKYKSPDSEYSDYTPYNERKRNSLHKKGRRSKNKKDSFKIRSKGSMKIKSPKYSHNSYLYKSPPKTPTKVQQSQLLTGEKGYSPTGIVTKMLRETKQEDLDFKPCTGKPLLSVDTFFDRFKEMGMQYIINECRSSKSASMLKELQSLNQVNSYLSNKLKAKAAKLEQLRKLNARLSVPYTTPMKQLPEPAPMNRAVVKLLSTLHKPSQQRNDTILAETWLDEESVSAETEKKIEKKEEKVETKEEEVTKIPVPPSMSALVEKPTTENTENKSLVVPTTDVPQVIIAGDPPMAYTYKDGSLVGYNPETLQSSVQYSKLIEDQYNKVVEQHYKEKISAAYFEAQRRHYEGLLQHQIQTKIQSSSDYLTQAYLTEPWNSNYYYGQQSSGRQMPSLTPHFPSTSQQSYSGTSSQSYPGTSSTPSSRP